MPQVIAMQSYRGGTGKSSTAANLALIAARAGKRVALVDTDIQSPGMHVLFGISDMSTRRSLSDYLIGHCEIEHTADRISVHDGTGELYLITARSRADEINEIMMRGYDVGLLPEGFRRLIETYMLDALILDTGTGVSNETISAVASSDSLLIVTRADHLVAEASEAVSLAGQLNHPRRMVIVNMLPEGMSEDDVRERAEHVYQSPVVMVLPYCPEMAAHSSQGLFARDYPDHRIVSGYREVASAVLNGIGE